MAVSLFTSSVILLSLLPSAFPLQALLLSCGSPSPVPSHLPTPYVPDTPYISSGTPLSLSLPNLLPHLSTLRSFPLTHPLRSCFSLPVQRSSRYLVRTTFFYGAPAPPIFDLLIDGTFWTKVNTTEDYGNGKASYYEGVWEARGGKLSLCVAGNDVYTVKDPFINTVEVILLEGTVYNATDFTRFGMGLVARSVFGYDGATVRYPDDQFDRFWEPFSGSGQRTSSTQNISGSGFWNLPPDIALNTALAADQVNPMELMWPPVSLQDSSYYIALYFADPSFGGSRRLDVHINDYSFYGTISVTQSGLALFATPWNLSGFTKIVFTPDSLLPPLVNAGEIFGLIPLGGLTIARDVIALLDIKGSLDNPPADWSGDPCMPRGYSWTGVTCFEGTKIRVVSLNLSSMGLRGFLSPKLANLSALTDISFADNKLTGIIPDLIRLKKLQKLDLQGNQLTGVIPPSLGNLNSLQELFLQNNNLQGDIPTNLKRPGRNVRLRPGNHFST